MKVTILGNNSALPAFGRHPTAQVVSVYGEVILLDCGEGVQSQMQRFGLRWRKLRHICISHLHGDHYFGLFGLLTSMNLLGRTLPLYLHAPPQLEEILTKMLVAGESELCFPFHFRPLEEGKSELLEENDSFLLRSFPVNHRISCHGFVIEQKTRGRKLLPAQCALYGIPPEYFGALKQGADYTTPEGVLIKNEWVTVEGPMAKKYAYCADTRFAESLIPYIENADTIYHEATYLDHDAEKASVRYHSTARQAAEIARMANVKKLLLGHFSSKYKDLAPFAEEAAQVFPNTVVTREGTAYEI